MRKWLIVSFVVTLLLMSMIPTAPAQDDPFGAAWFDDGIMYEVFVRSFRDSNGDGIGDLQGVMESLDYLQSLGVQTIWLMPIHPSPSYHGYDVTDYYDINPDYGTVDDLVALIEEVHNRDMYIIMDYVANHTSDQHPFFISAFANPDSEFSYFHTWLNDEHTQYNSFAGFGHMPEINYDSQEARDYMLDVAQYWMDPNGDGNTSDGFDGFRCDVAIGPPLDFWAELRTVMRETNPEAVLLAEAWLRGNGLNALQPFLEGDSFNAAFDFPAFHSLVADHDVNGDGTVSGASTGEFLEIGVLGGARLFDPGAHLVRFVNNHDTNRIMSEVEGDQARARAAAVWLMTIPETPMIYYGEEIGMLGIKGTGTLYYDEYRREPMDWYAAEEGPGMTSWFRPDNRYNAPNDGISVEEQEADPTSLLNFYRTLGELHNSTPALRTGDVGRLDISSEGVDLYAMWRGAVDGDKVLIIINFQSEAVTASFLTPTMGDILLSQGFSLDGDTFTIEAAGYAIIAP